MSECRVQCQAITRYDGMIYQLEPQQCQLPGKIDIVYGGKALKVCGIHYNVFLRYQQIRTVKVG